MNARQFLWTTLALLMLAATSSAQPPWLRLWKVDQAADDALAVKAVHDVAYHPGPKKDPRHHLDLFVPKDKKDFPVLLLVHGGGWTIGDNRCFGLYSSVGEFLASRGIGVAMPNYRLSPWVKHPDHVKDVAKALAWTKANIAQHGGDPEQLYLCGHSAGGHLVALLATDETYLKGEGLKGGDIKGVIGVSGVYRIPDGKVKVGGDSGEFFDVAQLAPLRAGEDPKEKTKAAAVKPFFAGLPLSVEVYGAAFGLEAKVRAQASPVTHVRPGLPPFLILAAENELPTLAAQAEEFHKALAGEGGKADFRRIANRNHSSILFSAIRVDDPVARAVVEFIQKKRP